MNKRQLKKVFTRGNLAQFSTTTSKKVLAAREKVINMCFEYIRRNSNG